MQSKSPVAKKLVLHLVSFWKDKTTPPVLSHDPSSLGRAKKAGQGRLETWLVVK